MVRKYLKNGAQRQKKVFRPKHPHLTRNVLEGDDFLTANSWDDVSFDAVPLVPYHSVTDEIMSGKEPQKIGSLNGSVNTLAAARLARQFLVAFERAGQHNPPAPEPALEPAPEPAPTPAPAPEPKQ